MFQNASANPPARIGMKLRTIAMRRFSVMSNSGFLLYFLARSFTCLLSAMYSKMKRKTPMPRPIRAPWITGFMARLLAWVKQNCLALGAPGRLVLGRNGFEIGGARSRGGHPFAGLRATVCALSVEGPVLELLVDVAAVRVVQPQQAEC